MKKVVLLVVLLWGGMALSAQESVVTIEQARYTSYYTDEATEDEIIVFTGDVVISVVQGKSTSRIQADQVNFNRSRNLLYASGNVTLDRDSGNGEPEHLTAESILFNIDSEEGVFNSGTVVHSNSGAINVDTDSKLVASAELFARDDSGTVAFKRGSLTFCDEPDPHWKINASRIWLLPGNEFAFANALLYIGKVPVMYFPFFYYPKDELIFNPVFGYDQRKGYGIQTTTYLVGRKKPSEKKDEDSFFSFLNSSIMYKQRREGLVLRNLEEKDTDSYPHTLKFMADYYTNLGGMVGMEGIFSPENEYISKLDFSLYLGFSQTLFPFSQGGVSIYSPYDSQGMTYSDKSNFLGMELPFRYRGNFGLTMTKPFTLNVSIPLYSDPYFNKDFLEDRKESMDWLNFLMSNTTGVEEESTTGELTSFLWSVTASYSPPIQALKPYVSTFTISPSFNMNFYSFSDVSGMTAEVAKVSPRRKSYYPGFIKPFFLKTTIDGTIFSYPAVQESREASFVQGKQVAKDDLHLPPEFMDEDSEDAGNEEDGQEAEEGKEGEPVEQDEMQELDDPLGGLQMPSIAVATPSILALENFSYSLKYSISPDFSTELRYLAPAAGKTFDWDELNSSFLYLSVPTTLSSSLKYRNAFFTITNSLSFLPVYQTHPVYNNEAQRDNTTMSDYIARKLDLNSANQVESAPFALHPNFSGTNISWKADVRVLRTKFTGTLQEPQWEYQLPTWNAESFLTHAVTMNLSHQRNSFTQRIALTSYLPPLNQSYTGSLTLGFPFVSLNLGTGMQHRSLEDKTWIFTPLTQSLSVTLLNGKVTFSQSYRYNIDGKYNENLDFRLSGYNVSMEFYMKYISGYVYDPALGWKTRGEKVFQPSTFDLSYTNRSGRKFNFWKGRIALTPGLGTRLSWNFLQPTSSYFTFDPSVTFTINEFLNITFTASTRNDVMYRYVQNLTDFEPKIPGETNIFVDLWNSFSFWNEAARKASGFKLKSLDVTLTHELHDWTLSSQIKISPRIITVGGRSTYDFSPHFTLSVVWRPMSSMKTTVEDKYGTFTLNP